MFSLKIFEINSETLFFCINIIDFVVTSTGAVGSGAQADTASLGHPADVLDMPVDPNEPTYCLCHQVSYGEMIGCDNPDVSIIFLLKINDNFKLNDK